MTKMEEKNRKLSISTTPEIDGNPRRKKSFWRIDKRLLPVKMHFFLFVGGMGAFLPYQSVLGITKFGLTAGNLAAAWTAQQILVMVFNPVIGYLVDYFNKLKATIIILTILQAVFAFFLIIIPNADIQKMEASQASISVDSNHNCYLCNHTEEFKNVSFNQFPEGDSFKKVLDCFEYVKVYESNDVIHCSKESINSSYGTNISYVILQRICDNSLSKIFFSPINYTMQQSIFSTVVLFYTQTFSISENSSIVCLSPKEKLLFRDNFSYYHMKQYCYSLSKDQTAYLQNLAPSVPYNTRNCQSYTTNTSANENIDHTLTATNFKTYQFWIFALCLIISCTCTSSIFTMSDTTCYETIKGADYGKQRAWGTAGWGLFAPLAGFLNDYTGGYMPSWLLMVLLCSLQIWNLSRMDLVKPDLSPNIRKDVKAVFSSTEFLAFEAGILMNGMFTAITWFYLTWFLTSIGGNKLIIGLAYAVECFLGEVPILFVSGWMIKKMGHFNLVTLALFCQAVRFFIYSYLHNPWLVLPVECLQGFTYGSFYAALTSYGKLKSKPGIEATTQSVLCTTFEAVGTGLGCVISGVCFDYYGSHTTFFYASFVAAAAAVLNIVSSLLIRCSQKVDLKVTETDERY